MAHENEQQSIRQLQTYLRHLSYFNEEIGEVPIDGIFDSATEDALIAFQRMAGLPQSGRADFVTFEALVGAYESSVAQRQTPNRFAYFPRIPENYTVEVGEEQFLVRIIQHALQELDVVYGDLGEVPQSGQYDEATASAVRRFQGKHGLDATGAVDLRTWNALADVYNRTFDAYFRE